MTGKFFVGQQFKENNEKLSRRVPQSNEPTHEIMALITLLKLNLQTRMRSNPLALSSTSILNVCEQQRLWLDCAPDPSLFAYAISTIIS